MKFSSRLTGLLDKRNLIFMVMRMTNQDLINVHDDHKSDTSDYHCKRKILIWVQTWGWWQWGLDLCEIRIESCDGFGNDVQHCNWEEQTARKSHGYWHDLAFTETLEVWDESAENDHLQKECEHQADFDYHWRLHHCLLNCLNKGIECMSY